MPTASTSRCRSVSDDLAAFLRRRHLGTIVRVRRGRHRHRHRRQGRQGRGAAVRDDPFRLVAACRAAPRPSVDLDDGAGDDVALVRTRRLVPKMASAKGHAARSSLDGPRIGWYSAVGIVATERRGLSCLRCGPAGTSAGASSEAAGAGCQPEGCGPRPPPPLSWQPGAPGDALRGQRSSGARVALGPSCSKHRLPTPCRTLNPLRLARGA